MIEKNSGENCGVEKAIEGLRGRDDREIRNALCTISTREAERKPMVDVLYWDGTEERLSPDEFERRFPDHMDVKIICLLNEDDGDE